MKSWLLSAVLALAALSPALAQARLKLPLLYSEGAVLQRNQPMRIWGWDTPGAKVTVRFDGKHAVAVTNDQGRWQVTLPAHAAGGPYALDISDGHDRRRISHVLVGDVWLCSGQSNMEFTVSEASHADAEQAWAHDPFIRQFKVPRSYAVTPKKRLHGGSWVASDPTTVGQFSAVCWFFARRMRDRTGVAQGLINDTWGGSSIQAWTDAQTGHVDRQDLVARLKAHEASEQTKMAKTRQRLQRWPTLHHDVMTADGAPAWAAEKLDVSSWVRMPVPADWETAGYEDMDGVAWYRTHFTLSASEAAQGVILGLGKIDDSDRSYVNGHLIGHTENLWNRARVYKVPPSALHAGRNTIAVRVHDLMAGGGIYGASKHLYVQLADGPRRPLAGTWLFHPAAVTLVPTYMRQVLPSVLYNAMIHPIEGYPLRGMLWYQGAANALLGTQAAQAYRDQFKALITSWRAKWHRSDLPFIWVQLANYDADLDTAAGSPWAALRASQSAALSLPATGQVVTIDLGSSGTIHPLDKRDVGYRLALVACRVVFGDDIVDAGPVFRSLHRQGDAVALSFDTQGETLAVREGGQVVHGFEITGADGQYHPAKARIEGPTVLVSSARVAHPTAVRYAWSEDPVHADLINRDGLPATPFRVRVP